MNRISVRRNWDAGIRTPISRSRVCGPTVGRRPKAEHRKDNRRAQARSRPLFQDGAGSEPPRFREKVGSDGSGVVKPFPHGQLLRVWFVLIRPVDEERLSDEVFARSQSPKPAVIAVVTISSHEEEVIARNADWSEVITPADLLGVEGEIVRL